jgi:LPS-assembly lipoprotein
MQRRDLLRLTLAAGAGLALTACGYRLRGLESGRVIEELSLAGPESELSRRVADHLAGAGTRLHDDAPLILNLGAESFSERRLSVLDSGPREVELSLAVPFSVQRRRDGAYHLDQQRIEVDTRITVTDDELLVQEDIREEAREQLRREAARLLLARLRAIPQA